MQRFLDEASRFQHLTRTQEVSLARRVALGDLAARERLITSNLRLVIRIARGYRDNGMPLSDLVQEGTIGLIRAIETYDWRLGFRFSDHANWWVRLAVQRGVANKARTIRIPVHVLEYEQKVTRAERELKARCGNQPTDAEVAAAAGLPVVRVRTVRLATRVITSLDDPLAVEAGGRRSDSLTAAGTEPDDEAAAGIRADALHQAISKLPGRERDVIAWRFGLTENGPSALAEISQRLGVPGKRVRRIEADALRRLARDASLRAATQLAD
jgi:RNA polymerase primary sigma factor